MLSFESPQSAGHGATGSSYDHVTDSVPLSERRGPLTMGLLWLTMVTGFPSVLIGFDWFKAGYTLPQIVQCTLISFAILLMYSVPAAYLGAKSGQTYSLLSRGIFGKYGSWLVSINLVWVSVGWYGLNAIFLAEGLKGLYHWPVHIAVLSGILALLMAFNNFFGFSGIANFARYLAAPVLIAWVGYTFCKAAAACPVAVLTAEPHQPFPGALTVISSFVVGYSVWGNEADYWRFGKARFGHLVVPLVVTLFLGQLIFPLAGWMMARLTGVTDYASATALMNQYAFGGVSLIAAIVLTVTYFAVNDSGLYGAINALENIRELPRRQVVSYLAVGGAAVAMLLSSNPKAFELVATLSSIVLPCATVVMLTEFFVMSKVLRVPVDLTRVAQFNELPPVRTPALAAIAAGFVVGVSTSGLVPGLDWLHVGVCSLQAWLATFATYMTARILEYRRAVARHEKLLAEIVRQYDQDASLSATTSPAAR